MKRTPNNFDAKNGVDRVEAKSSKRFRNEATSAQPGTSLSACAGSFSHLASNSASMLDQYSKVFARSVRFDHMHQSHV
ncbi:hypothetical protein BpHYR1_049297 [Brachionus plicatilis]|uniref:Uncharacterized protein n=1 Tax=Brachionus plicatilis TaxID=10195 RepID=A0A3M7QIP8_BRAPC|nr:hypothetical protein BpHYR1_049297 [Brachionus plicatilis]